MLWYLFFFLINIKEGKRLIQLAVKRIRIYLLALDLHKIENVFLIQMYFTQSLCWSNYLLTILAIKKEVLSNYSRSGFGSISQLAAYRIQDEFDN